MVVRADASGVAVDLARPPRRIVSLVPSITETLCALGLADALVGITVYCVEPHAIVSGKTRIGGEKNPDLEKIRRLEPDLVIANIEENLRDHVETLRSWSIPVWVTYPRTVAEGIQLIADLGAVTSTEARPRFSGRSSRSTTASSARRPGGRRSPCSTRSGAGRI